jgi:hypothetical protein
MNIGLRLKAAAMIVMISALTVGCGTTRRSEIPYFIQKLEGHSFTLPEKETIGELLRYVNDLESR